MLKVGDVAPTFSVMSDEENLIQLNDYRGKKVILYFYPKDDTPGCTTEACDFQSELKKFEQINAVVLGVSRDDVKSHQKFKAKYRLHFPLLADTTGALCQAYGVLVEKNRFGKKAVGIERSTFLIDEMGRIQKIWRKVSVTTHIDDVLKAMA